MADFPLFRDTNMDAVTSRVNTLHQFSFTLKAKLTTITKISNSASLWTRDRGELRNGLFVWRGQTQNSLTGANTKQCLRKKKVTRIQGLYRSVSRYNNVQSLAHLHALLEHVLEHGQSCMACLIYEASRSSVGVPATQVGRVCCWLFLLFWEVSCCPPVFSSPLGPTLPNHISISIQWAIKTVMYLYS